MIFAIYKEKGPTSRDVVNKVKKIKKEKKVGHAGTLDPLAEGVLVIGVGRESTKKLHTEEFDEKEYLATIELGKESSTDDEEGEKKIINIHKKPKKKEIEKILLIFIGEILQRPPEFSAVKIKGREAYKYARKGVPVKPQKRKVSIKKIDLINYKHPFLKIKVETGKGVYIRSLARDIGKKLLVGGYLKKLTRTRVGRFNIKDCRSIHDLEI